MVGETKTHRKTMNTTCYRRVRDGCPCCGKPGKTGLDFDERVSPAFLNIFKTFYCILNHVSLLSLTPCLIVITRRGNEKRNDVMILRFISVMEREGLEKMFFIFVYMTLMGWSNNQL